MRNTLLLIPVISFTISCGPSGPTFEEVFKSNKGLMDSVRNSFSLIAASMADSGSGLNSMMKADGLSTLIEYDGATNNNMEIISWELAKDPDGNSSSGLYYTYDLMTALSWTGKNNPMTPGAMKEEAGEYGKSVFQKVRDKYKYLCVYRYLDYTAPEFTSVSEYKEGYADVEVLLFDLKNAKKLGGFRFIAESDSVINYTYDMNGGEAAQISAGTAEAVKELDEKCKWMIKKGLQEITGTELKVWVNERQGPYFVDREGDDNMGRAE